MRTAIFVYESTTVTIKCTDSGVQVVPFSGGSPFAPTGDPQSVTPGMYKLVSSPSSSVSVSSGASSTLVLINPDDKDKWPDPPAVLPSTMTGTTSQQISDFFVIPGARSLAS